MDIVDIIKSQMDLNKDGKLSKEDLESLKDGKSNALIDQLKKQADLNKDGKIDAKDLSKIQVDKIADKLKGVFSSKKK